MGKTIFSGIKPTGSLHLGNYIGAVKHWVNSQNDDALRLYCVVDLHAITVDQNPDVLRQNSKELSALLVACGLDLDKSLLFIQSQNPDHASLAWILNCYISMGQMNRMTQYKEKSEGKDSVSVGLFDYPALMAADILLYDTTEVPVGEDQKQHVELARDVAGKFNSRHGETFVLPNPVIPEFGGRVMSLTTPEKKMSKSERDPNGTIDIFDTADKIRKKVGSAVTDSENSVKHDENRPGIRNLIEIYSELSGKNVSEVESEFEGKGYGDFKKAVAEQIIASLSPIQEKYNELVSSDDFMDRLAKNAARAYEISHKKLEEVYDKVGFVK